MVEEEEGGRCWEGGRGRGRKERRGRGRGEKRGRKGTVSGVVKRRGAMIGFSKNDIEIGEGGRWGWCTCIPPITRNSFPWVGDSAPEA